jgi:FtsP/CotA-like multicopper oxidase with cupredoxin domain
MNLGTAMKDNSMVYTINNRTYPNTEPLDVNEGDLVKVTLKNTSKSADHPMHLHGLFFQVLSKNGSPIEGSPLMKDTLNVKPGEEYVVAFKADNPGNWMFHCHDLHHASAGMVTEVKYKGYKASFTPDPNANNKPE